MPPAEDVSQSRRFPVPFTSQGYSFTEQGITTYAPRSSGVYGIYNSQEWIYIGEAEDVEARLFQHLRGQSDQSACIKGRNPTTFAFEFCDASTRLNEEQVLIAELRPYCQG
jgi:predicted GIY-YIG superfamily endonuclease